MKKTSYEVIASIWVFPLQYPWPYNLRKAEEPKRIYGLYEPIRELVHPNDDDDEYHHKSKIKCVDQNILSKHLFVPFLIICLGSIIFEHFAKILLPDPGVYTLMFSHVSEIGCFKEPIVLLPFPFVSRL